MRVFGEVTLSEEWQTQDQQQPSAETAGPQPDVEAAEETTAQPAGNGEIDLRAELQKAQATAAEYLDGWQRARAEFANYRKRVDREREEQTQIATFEVLRKLLPVLDDFERALENLPPELAEHGWVKGVVLIRDKFLGVMQGYQITEINPLGEPFDPTRHEAIGADNSDEVASGHITAVLQKGYLCGDRVLRPALVRVAN